MTIRGLVVLPAILLLSNTALGSEFDWLVGCWESADAQETEIWVQEPDGSLIGFSSTVRDNHVVFYELLSIEIEPDGTATYRAYPSGQSAASFELRDSGEHSVLFANLSHDYPQEIAYRRQGDRLTARISASGGKEPRSFHKQRCRPGKA